MAIEGLLGSPVRMTVRTDSIEAGASSEELNLMAPHECCATMGVTRSYAAVSDSLAELEIRTMSATYRSGANTGHPRKESLMENYSSRVAYGKRTRCTRLSKYRAFFPVQTPPGR